jgi:hypothetical protein
MPLTTEDTLSGATKMTSSYFLLAKSDAFHAIPNSVEYIEPHAVYARCYVTTSGGIDFLKYGSTNSILPEFI